MNEGADWPKGWTGRWSAADGKTVLVERLKGRLLVTVSPTRDGRPYTSAELLGGGTKSIERLPATCLLDPEGRRCLEIEAGTESLGPTYRLYAALDDVAGRRRAPTDTPRADLVLIPNTSIGLYDDYEDDLGVPWALPLEAMRFIK